ncbi:MAG: YicC family protein [Sandaracinaceae bacterium]
MSSGVRDSQLASMTGQGSAYAQVRGAEGSCVGAEVRCVNHRYLDVRVRAPGALAEHAHAAEDIVRRRLVRGRIELALTLEGESASAPVLDVPRARAAFEQLVALRDALAPREPVPLGLLAMVPDLFRGAHEKGREEALREAVLQATERACEATSAMRLREGAALVSDFELRLGRLLEGLEAVEARIPAALEAARVRLRDRIERLLDPSVALDHARLEHEIALLADRADVAEECTRLRSHVAQLRAALREPTEGRGKRIDFLCQELGREVNTLGQKSADAAIAARVIDLKCEVERMREQAQNVL